MDVGVDNGDAFLSGNQDRRAIVKAEGKRFEHGQWPASCPNRGDIPSFKSLTST